MASARAQNRRRGRDGFMEYHATQRQGARPYQEDTWCAAAPAGWHFFAVLDGHGGDATARYAAQALPRKITEKLKSAAPAKALRMSFQDISAVIEPRTDDGATALAALVGHGQLHWANAGDCRLLLVTANGCLQLTTDHRLDQPAERRRIENIGRAKILPPYLYVGSDGLMPTRSLGDRRFKPAGVVSTPEIGQRLRDENDRWLVAATDGVWDALSNQQVRAITGWHKTPRHVAEAIADAALQNGSTDNVTVLAINIAAKEKPRG